MIRRVHKFHAKPVREAGRFYASQAERDYHAELKLREIAGEVTAITCQPVVPLVAGITYRPDFYFWETGCRDGARPRYVDVKGVETEAFRLKCKLWRKFGPAPLLIVKRSGRRGGFVVTKEIIPA